MSTTVELICLVHPEETVSINISTRHTVLQKSVMCRGITISKLFNSGRGHARLHVPYSTLVN